MLTHVAEENQQRRSERRPSCVRLQCLRCRSEFTLKGDKREEVDDEEEAGGRMRRGAASLPGGSEELHNELTKFYDDTKGEAESAFTEAIAHCLSKCRSVFSFTSVYIEFVKSGCV